MSIVGDLTRYNYRVLATEGVNYSSFAIHRVYYDVDGIPVTYGAEPAQVYGMDIEDLMVETQQISKAFSKTILYAGNRFPEQFKSNN